MTLNAQASRNDALSAPYGDLAFLLDLNPPLSDFRRDAHAALSATPRRISPMYLYNERGSELFSQITRLPGYYPTGTERAIFEAHARRIAEAIGPGRIVFEYGAGSPEKIDRLLSMLISPQGYVAMDISRDYLISGMQAYAARVDLPVGAVCADFNQPVDLPRDAIDADEALLGFFPGSTIGNVTRDAAASLLSNAARTLGREAKFLIGVDLEKDEAALRLAYDEPEGVTAEFILNVLRRMRDELGATVELGAFRYLAEIEDDPQRVEMAAEATRETTIRLDGESYSFAAGEKLHISRSHKYSLARFDELLARTPWRRSETWTDADSRYALCLLSNG
ncbi:MAG: L-histidine N(alpha)-methyltransferase [Pseudomonadota bacterium]